MSLPNTTCLYKSIDLIAGEQFILPPGATIINTTVVGAVTSNCPISFPTEGLACYKIQWTSNLDKDGATTFFAPGYPGTSACLSPFITLPLMNKVSAWEEGDSIESPIIITEIGTKSSSKSVGSIHATDLTSLENSIRNSPFSGLLNNRKYNSGVYISPQTSAEQVQWGNRNQSGFYYYELYFKGIPSLVKDFYIQLGGGTDVGSGLNNKGTLTNFLPMSVDCATYPTTSTVVTC